MNKKAGLKKRLTESGDIEFSLFLRNLMSMDTEEMLRAQPMGACSFPTGQYWVGGIAVGGESAAGAARFD